MKMSMLLISLLATTALAADPNQSWSELNADPSVSIRNPYQLAFGRISLFNACVTATEIRSIKPVTVCIEEKVIDSTNWDGGAPSYECTAHETKNLVKPRTYTQDVCIDYAVEQTPGGLALKDCTQWATRTVTIPQSFEVQVSAMGGEGSSKLFYKEFALPSCK